MTARYRGSSTANHGCCRISGIVMRLSGSTSSMREMRWRAPGERCVGSVYTPFLIFLNRFGMFSSSNGSEPQRRAYRMTPQLHTSTSGPA